MNQPMTRLDTSTSTSMGLPDPPLGILGESSLPIPEGYVPHPNEIQPPCHHTDSPDRKHTCQHPYHSPYSGTNLPLLLFRLEKPGSYNPSSRSPNVRHLIENGEMARDADGNQIRDFWFLPRQISNDPPSWLLEFWMRSDPRLKYKDIRARMNPRGGDLPSENSLRARRDRFSLDALGLSSWYRRRGPPVKGDLKRVQRWSLDQISLNTTMTVEYSAGSRGHPIHLIKRTLGPEDTPKRYPLHTFLENGRTHRPQKEMRDSLNAFMGSKVDASPGELSDSRD